MTTDTSLDDANLVQAVKELLINSTDHLKEARRNENEEDLLMSLESRDKNFDKRELVRIIRSQIDDNLGPAIDREIERYNDNKARPNVAGRITDSVLNTSEFQALSDQLKLELQNACDILHDNSDDEFADVGLVNVNTRTRKHDVLYSETESSLGEGSSLNQSNCNILFVSQEQLVNLARQLSQPSIEERKQAMHSFLQIPTADIGSLHGWNDVSRPLLDAMSDPDDDLWKMCMKFISRGLSTSAEFTKEVYAILIDYISSFFAPSSHMSTLPPDIDLSLNQIQRLLKAVRLMNEFQRHIPQYWVRIANNFIERILRKTFDLLTLPPLSRTGITPLHIVSLLDSKAQWFVCWMHGFISRQPFFELLKKHRVVVEQAVKIIYQAANLGPKRTNVKRLAATPRLGQFVYSRVEIDAAFLIHSICFMSKLLKFKIGRKMFPFDLPESEKSLSLQQFIISVLNIVIQWDMKLANTLPDLALDMLKNLVGDTNCAECCVCNDEVMSSIMAPFAAMLEQSEGYKVSDQALLRLTEILSVIASSTAGRLKLLYGEKGQRLNRVRSAPAHILAQVVHKSLIDELDVKRSNAVISNILYVCRQIYSTQEGLLMLSSYKLHQSINSSWRDALRNLDDAPTPTNSDDGDLDEQKSDKNLIFWEDNLRDNLLSMAATPNGVLLLHQTGALEECVCYMHKRLVKNLQVSKMEKFGYGFMLSQIAATAPGIRAVLDKTDYVKRLCIKLWKEIECVDDSYIFRPKPWQITPISKYALKPFNNLLAITSSFASVYENLYKKELPVQARYSLRDLPTSIEGLLDRLVFIDANEKRQALFKYEESHVLGLRWLSVMVSCLDTMLLLQTQYRFDEILIKEQNANVVTVQQQNDVTKETHIFDMLSSERSHILVRALALGGPTERILPPRERISDMSLREKKEVEIYPPVCSMALPKNYLPQIDIKVKSLDTDLWNFLNETKKQKVDEIWLEKAQSLVFSALTTKPDTLHTSCIREILDRAAHMIIYDADDAIFPAIDFVEGDKTDSSSTDNSIKNFKLPIMQENGIRLLTKYGQRLKLLQSGDAINEKLIFLMKKCGYFLQQQQKPCSPNALKWVVRPKPPCDWFVGVLFLIFSGNGERTWKLLQQISCSALSSYVWPNRLHRSIHLPVSIVESGMGPLHYIVCQRIDLIVHAELPQVASAFKMSGLASSLICEQWIRQSFLNYMDWTDITHYVALIVLFGVDYIVYVCVAVFKHLQKEILENCHSYTLLVYLKEEPFKGFRISDYMQYMKNLEQKYRQTIRQSLRMIGQP
ncbi:DgyrCDS8055 [Dimorphilus gyrociliatus]|uniref:DgyrCDS8055 n=1 Tax=Dimorphilus gyrociliatus TaxID=2664684 RepID=A0A7I8VY13_9ANNE|nr:DgyrCDS8055 [Dimorphilus gyrociliatus]